MSPTPIPPLTTVHGMPRIGARRELKVALERHWRGGELEHVEHAVRDIRRSNWVLLRDAGIDLIPSNDFSLYDHVLDTAVMVGAVPRRFGHPGGSVPTETYFAMARGSGPAEAMEMTKWFDTNYHHIVPELRDDTRFELSSAKPVDEFIEARDQGIVTKPVLLGPVTFLLLAKPETGTAPFDRLALLEPLLDVYEDVLRRLGAEGAQWVQLDEPAFAQDRSTAELDALTRAYTRLAATTGRPRLIVSTYFDEAGGALQRLVHLPIEGIGLDLVRGAGDVARLKALGGVGDRLLVAGVVDGRNVWADDLGESLELLRALRKVAQRLAVSTSCSLMHVPRDVEMERRLEPGLRSWLAFARQKVDEVVFLGHALAHRDRATTARLRANREVLESRRSSPEVIDRAVRERAAAVSDADLRRELPADARRELQRKALRLPRLPVTTIGSFPQTAEVRAARADRTAGRIDGETYRALMRHEVRRVIALQERLGVDVLVHGEPERNDMVRYFAERLSGFAMTEHGWVQSYGTRCVRPPILYGDVSRPRAMTVEWHRYAQSLTARPVKGMLTGPVTMLRWSFVRDDQPDDVTCRQIALALRDEVGDLQAAGARVIQVDEPALREGLPLRGARRDDYLRWSTEAFRLAVGGAAAATQVHTHMCYAEFGDILRMLDEMEIDVLSLEASRSRLEIVGDLARAEPAFDVGPGVWDIHSPRIPGAEEIAGRLRQMVAALGDGRVWVNPDCGLKTRTYAEVVPALGAMVAAAREVRGGLPAEDRRRADHHDLTSPVARVLTAPLRLATGRRR